MLIKDALSILNLAAGASAEDIAAAYKQAALKYHPDRNPAGAEMMKLVNAAHDALTEPGVDTNAETSEDHFDYADALNGALNAIIHLDGLDIEICGAWVWVSGETYKHRAELKAAGFRYASKKKMWNFRPDNWRSKSRGTMAMDDIRETYGSVRPKRPYQTAISA